MINLTAQARNRNAGTYFRDHLARGDEAMLTTDETRIVGRWFGSGALKLGLCGAVSAEPFLAVCKNLHPLTRKVLRPRTAGIAFYDVTYSVPKSVSLLSLFDGRVEKLLRQAWDDQWPRIEAQAGALDYRGDFRIRPKSLPSPNLVGALFLHYWNRELQPDLHLHAVVQSLTFSPSREQWLGLDAYPLYLDQKFNDACLHANLAAGLIELGYDVVQCVDGFRISGVSEELEESMSTRRAQVLAAARDEISRVTALWEVAERTAAEDRELNRLSNLTRRKLLEHASLLTRKKKGHRNIASVRDYQLALFSGEQRIQMQNLVQNVKARSWIKRSKTKIRRQLDSAICDLSEQCLAFRVRDLHACVLRSNLGSLRPAELNEDDAVAGLSKLSDGYYFSSPTMATAESIISEVRPTANPRPFAGPREGENLITGEIGMLANAVMNAEALMSVVVVSGEKTRRGLVMECRTLAQKVGNNVLTIFEPRLDIEGVPLKSDDGCTVTDFIASRSSLEAGFVFISESALGGPTRAQKILEKIAASGASLFVTRGRTGSRIPRFVDWLIEKGSLPVIDARKPSADRRSVQREASGAVGLMEELWTVGRVFDLENPDFSVIAGTHCDFYEGGHSVASLAPRRTHNDLNLAIRKVMQRRGKIGAGEVAVAQFNLVANATDANWAELTQNISGYRKGQRFRVEEIAGEAVRLCDENGGAFFAPLQRTMLLERRISAVAPGEWIRTTRTCRGANGSKVLAGRTYRIRSISDSGMMLTNGVQLRPDHGHWEYAYAVGPGKLSPGVLDTVVACVDGAGNSREAAALVEEAARIARHGIAVCGQNLERLFPTLDLANKKKRKTKPPEVEIENETPGVPEVVDESPSEEDLPDIDLI